MCVCEQDKPCVYVCVCVCVCVFEYVHTSVCEYVHTSGCLSMCIPVCACPRNCVVQADYGAKQMQLLMKEGDEENTGN